MSGVFSEWQPRYAEHGIATFPIGQAKKPCITGWQKIGIKGSAELAAKFVSADALGYVTGRRSNITVLDIDTPDEKIAQDAIRQHGQPAIVTRTASGKLHLLYRYNGENRRIRPWPDLPIDVLGDNGYALAAPSKLETGSYEIIHGHLDDLARLKPMAGGLGEIAVVRRGKLVTWSEMRDGDFRNRALWEYCMRTARHCQTAEELLTRAQERNQKFKEPIMELAQVEKTARSAWKYELAGLNFYSRPRIIIDHDTFDGLGKTNPDALLLLLTLERYHGGNDRFALAKPMAASMGWSMPRWKAARSALSQAGIIRCLHPGGRGPNDPPIYVWGTKGL
jgi:Bifunctional DNA primase/polymerase, N-terminal/Primase C terminal 1 (PriCT-1)